MEDVTKYVCDLFPVGFFVDVGLFDGKTENLTIGLESKGWAGIGVEAVHEWVERSRHCRKCNVVQACLSEKETSENFHLFKGYAARRSGLADTYEKDSLESVNLAAKTMGGTYQLTKVATQPLKSIVPPNTTVHFLCVNTCGSEVKILKNLPQPHPKLIAVPSHLADPVQSILPGYKRTQVLQNYQFFALEQRSFVVNLDRRPDRFNIFTERADAAGVTFERVSGVDGKLLTLDLADVHRFRADLLSKAEIGIAITHYRLWRQLAYDESNVECYHIMEDDVQFLSDFTSKMKNALSQAKTIDPNWRLLWLSSINKRYNQEGCPKASKSPSVVQPTGWDYFGGLWCYVISKRGAKELVQMIDEGKCNRAIDAWIAHLGPPHFPTLTCNPMIAFAPVAEKGGDTDIQNDKSKLQLARPGMSKHTCNPIAPVAEKTPDTNIQLGQTGVSKLVVKQRLSYLSLGKMGRLGNQLFEVAVPVLLSDERGYDLPLFNGPTWEHAGSFANSSKWFQAYDSKQHGSPKQIVAEPADFEQIQVSPQSEGLTELKGYFQNAAYFLGEDKRKRVEWLFQPTEKLMSSIERRKSQLLGKDAHLSDFCAIHIRRGDYLEQNICLPDNYYEAGINSIRSQYPAMFMLIFSDDIGFAQKRWGDRCFIVDSKPTEGDFEDICFMAACGAQIIANSSFSWWAAFLNRSPFINKSPVQQKMVVAPPIWFPHLPNSRNLLMPFWSSSSLPPPTVKTTFNLQLVEGGNYFQGFVAELLLRDHKVNFVERDVDATILSVFGDRHKSPAQVGERRIFICGEPRAPEFVSQVDAVLRLHCGKAPNTISLPFWIPSFFERKQHTLAQFRQSALNVKGRGKWKADDSKWCAFMYSNDVPYRNQFFDRLSQYRKVSALGRSRRNTHFPLDRHHADEKKTFYDLAVERYEGFKFVIAFESCQMDDYITEKLVNPMLCRSHPVIIYCGAPNVGKYFNTNSFINVADFAKIDEAIRYIIKVDQDPQLYCSIQTQPFMLPHQLPYSDLSRFSSILSSAISRRTLSKSNHIPDSKATPSDQKSVFKTSDGQNNNTTPDSKFTLSSDQNHRAPDEKSLLKMADSSSMGEHGQDDWTVVTGLFDIPTETGVKGSNRSIDFYLNYRFVLEINKPLVMFCDPSTYPKVWAIRRKAGLLSKTLFISMHLKDFPLWKYKDKIAENRTKPPVYDPNHRNTPPYFILTTGKFYMLQKAIELNPFKTKFVSWLDYGLEHISSDQAKYKYIDAAFAQKREKPSFCYISYLSPCVSLDPMKMYSFADGRCTIASSFFTGENQRMLRLCHRIEEEFVKVVNLGRGHAEEQLLATVHARHPEDFDMFYGDYQDQCLNYVSISSNAHAVLSFFIDRCMEGCLKDGDQTWSWAEDACRKLSQAAFINRTIPLSTDQSLRLLERYLQIAERKPAPHLLPEITKFLHLLPSEAQRRNSALKHLVKTSTTANVVKRILKKSTIAEKVDVKLVADASDPSRYLAMGKEAEISVEEVCRLSHLAWQHVDAVVYINLDHRTDRRDETLAEYKRLRIPLVKIHRFSAIKAPEGSHPAIGCNSSHLALIKMAKEKGWKNVLVNEDDFNFVNDRRLVWTRIDQFYQQNYAKTFDVVMFTSGGLQFAEPCDEIVNYARKAPNAAGYLVNSAFYDKLIACWEQALERLIATQEVHNYITDAPSGWQSLQTGQWFVFKPLLGYQRPSFSDLAHVVCDHHNVQRLLSKKDT